MRTNLEKALHLATEYRRYVTLGDIVLASQVRRTIEDLVGFYSEGCFRLPLAVERAMSGPE